MSNLIELKNISKHYIVNNPGRVGSALKIKNVSDINIKNNTFEADLELETRWNIEQLHSVTKDILKFILFKIIVFLLAI